MKRKFTAKVKGGQTYIVYAENEGAALRSLVKDYRIPYIRLSFITAEDINPEFVIQVGVKDYSCAAPDERAALMAFGKMGVDMSKAKNLRRR